VIAICFTKIKLPLQMLHIFWRYLALQVSTDIMLVVGQ